MRFAIGFLVLAAIVGLAIPIVAGILFWHLFSATWSTELPKYQALFGGLTALFAASLASIAVVLTIGNQRQIANRQLAAQRQEQDLARALTKQQIASAFIGEIEVALDELRHEFLKPVLETALHDLSQLSHQSPGPIPVGTARIYYDSNPGNVGLFPSATSQGLTRFYATLEEIRLDLDWYSTAIDTYTNQEKHIMSYPQMVRLIRKILHEINFCLESGPRLVGELSAIRDV